MIALVAGEVVVRRSDHVVIETASGVGYRLGVSSETLKAVPAAGGEVSLLTHLVVRDDALLLYGFASEAERELFLLLIGVQSVGPKVALALLSGGPPRELLAAVAASDKKRLTSVPGIGPRTADRIIVELREKTGAIAFDPVAADGDGAGEITASRADDPRLLARDGLVELGFEIEEAERLLRDAAGDSPETLLQHALKAARA